jgi:glycosyltransferase involved in cell wall biosynthesis
MGKAIVSTHQGSEGIPVIHEEHLLLADSPEQFIDALVRLIDQPDFREKLGNSALSFARNHFSVESSTRILLDFLSNRLKNHPDPSGIK